MASPKAPVPAKTPRKRKTPEKTEVVIRKNPYTAPKKKISATFQLFKQYWYDSMMNLDEEGMERLLNKFGCSTTWVYIAIRAIADACAQIPFRVVKEPRTGTAQQTVTGYDLGIIKLLREPNPWQRRFDFVEAAFINLELTGNCFIELVPDNLGRPAEMYVLNPSRVQIIPDPRKYVGGYLYYVNGRYITFPPEKIIHIKYYHPSNDYYGLSPLTTARLAVETDRSALEWNRNFLVRGSWPAGAIETEHDLEDLEVQRLQHMIQSTMQQGKNQAGKMLLLTGGLKYNPLAIKPRETDWLDARRMSRDEILAIFKVPFAVAGLFSTEQTTARSAGVEQQIKQFYRNTIFPKMEKFLEALNRDLVPYFRENYEILPNYRSVPALQDEVDQEFVRANALRALVASGLSLNKALARLYPETEPEPWGGVAWMNNFLVPVTGPEMPMPPEPNSPPNAPPPEPPPTPGKELLTDLGPEYERILERVLARGED